MIDNNAEWLNAANEKFESCAFSSIRGTSCRCSLNGYPVLDCPACNSYKEKQKTGGNV